VHTDSVYFSQSVGSLLDKNIAKGKMTAEEKQDILSRVKVAQNYSDFGSVDFAVEACSSTAIDFFVLMGSRL